MKLLKSGLLIFTVHILVVINVNAQTNTMPATISATGPQIGVAWGFAYGYDIKPVVFMPHLRKMGVNLTKLYLFWQQLEPSKDHYEWNVIDTFLKQLTPADEALISVFSSSLWATK